MSRLRTILVMLVFTLALAGCNGGGGAEEDGPHGAFELHVVDGISTANLTLEGVFAFGADGWKEAIPEGSALAFDGTGANITLKGELPAATYNVVRVLFGNLTVDRSPVRMTETGIELEVPFNVTDGGRTVIEVSFSWADALFKGADGSQAFAPALDALKITEDDTQRLALQASQIQTATKVPVARARIFDETGLEVFESSFVAESPEVSVIGTSGILTLSGAPSAAVKKGASLTNYTWDVAGDAQFTAYGATVRPEFPISGGNFTARLTVTDSQGLSDSQTVKLALKPGIKVQELEFTGTVSGATVQTTTTGGEVATHSFPITTTEFNGSKAQLVRAAGVLGASSSVPVNDLNLQLLDGAGASVASTSASGSQDKFDVTPSESAAPGEWTLRVVPARAYDATYTVRLTFEWKGINPGIEAFIAQHSDGHDHQH